MLGGFPTYKLSNILPSFPSLSPTLLICKIMTAILASQSHGEAKVEQVSMRLHPSALEGMFTILAWCGVLKGNL
jgi:hypothetical protein